ncbi:hypothetical protein [Micrococcus sp.]|uniref:hypothetical protein n=1 Tax=Micrococcus sp. TaxID=1271 RepID=UPI002A910C54|nr:hypothetical protein [Micrococcus sp.]MDY6054963.1 hypothetical protein [Micrococcus sp.]
MPSRPSSRRALTAVLPAAVLIGGLGLASPALAVPAPTDDGQTAGYFVVGDSSTVRFYTEHAVQEATVTVAPYTVSPDSPEGFYAGQAGTPTTVDSSYDAELERGAVDLVAQRRVLGEAGTGYVAFSLDVDGRPAAQIIVGPDANLADATGGEILRVMGPQEYSTADRPTVDHRTLLAAPGSRMVYLQGNAEGDAPGNASLTVVTAPVHGRLVSVPAQGTPQVSDPSGGQDRFGSTVYVADAGFTGTDQAVFQVADDTTGQVKTLVVTYAIGDQRADDMPLDPEAGGLPFDESVVWALLPADAGSSASPTAAPSASEPAQPSTTAAPAAQPTAPAPSASETTGEHAVPERVQTGPEPVSGWTLLLLGAAGVGLFAAARHLIRRA